MVHHRAVDMSKIDDEHIAIEECFALLRQAATQWQRGSKAPAFEPGPKPGVAGATRRTKSEAALRILFN